MLAYKDLDKLETLDRVMRECMRLITAVPGLARKTVKETEVLGYRIPADTIDTIPSRLDSPGYCTRGSSAMLATYS